MALNTPHKVTLTEAQIGQLIELVSTNNQYNEDEEEIESWNQIVDILEGVVDKYYAKIEKAKCKQPTAEWGD